MTGIFGAENQRDLLALSFAPHADGYAYYKDRWASGIPVSAAEREQYLTNWTPESAKAFRRRIAGRQPVTPPRGGLSAGQLRLQILGSIPKSAAIAPAASGLFAVFFLARTLPEALRAIVIGAGVFLVLVGVVIAIFGGRATGRA